MIAQQKPSFKISKTLQRAASIILLLTLLVIAPAWGSTIQADDPAGSIEIVHIAARGNRSYALAIDGSLWGWGENGSSQLGDGTKIDRAAPVQIPAPPGIIDIAITATGGAVLCDDGSVWEWWDETCCYSGSGNPPGIPYEISGLTGIIGIAAGENHILALDSNFTAWSWGNDQSSNAGQLARYITTDERHMPEEITNLYGVEVAAVAAGSHSSFFIDSTGGLWASGGTGYGDNDWWNDRRQVAVMLENGLLPVEYEGVGPVASFHAGGDHGIVVDASGDAWIFRQSSLREGSEPADTLVFGNIASIDITGENCGARILASDSSGSVWEAEIPDTPGTFSQVGGLSGIVSVSAGYGHSLALDSEGGLWSWGSNQYGQLGDGTTTDSATPILIIVGVPADAPASIEASILPDALYIPRCGTATAYATATVRDATGNALHNETVQWSIDQPTPTDVSIDPVNGEITVGAAAQEGTVTVRATSAAKPSVSGTAELTISEAAAMDYELTVMQGKEYQISVTANDIETFSDVTVKITYDHTKLQIINIADQTCGMHIAAGAIAGTGITVTHVSPGSVSLSFDAVIPQGKTWSGVITVLRFKAIVTGSAVVSVE